jgi:hypothetical protein
MRVNRRDRDRAVQFTNPGLNARYTREFAHRSPPCGRDRGVPCTVIAEQIAQNTSNFVKNLNVPKGYSTPHFF